MAPSEVIWRAAEQASNVTRPLNEFSAQSRKPDPLQAGSIDSTLNTIIRLENSQGFSTGVKKRGLLHNSSLD